MKARASAVYNHRIREATIKYAMLPHLTKTSASPFANIIREHFGRRSLALRAQCEKWGKQLRRHSRKAGKAGANHYVQVFEGGVRNSTPTSLEAATTLLYSQVNQLVAERSAAKQKAREESGGCGSSKGSSSSSSSSSSKGSSSSSSSSSSSGGSGGSSGSGAIILID